MILVTDVLVLHSVKETLPCLCINVDTQTEFGLFLHNGKSSQTAIHIL